MNRREFAATISGVAVASVGIEALPTSAPKLADGQYPPRIQFWLDRGYRIAKVNERGWYLMEFVGFHS